MRKGTKKKIIHGILIIIVIIFAVLASLVAVFRDVTMQSMIARSFAGMMSKQLETDVKIRTFYITEKLEICLEGLQINDYYDYPMLSIGTLTAQVSPTLDFDNIRLKDVYVKDVIGRVVRYEDKQKLNFNEIMARLGSGSSTDDSESNMHLWVDKLKIDNGQVVFWDQHVDQPEKLGMDYFHIDVSGIYGEFANLEVYNDTIIGDVLTLQGVDRCGITLDDLSGHVRFCEQSMNLDNLILNSGVTHIDMDARFEYDYSACFYEFEDSVRMICDVRPSTLMLSDLRYFSWIMDRMPDKIDFTTKFDGYVKDFTVTDFVGYFGDDSKIDFDGRFVGVEEFFDSYMDITMRELTSNYDDTRNFAIPIESKTVPMPESLKDIGTYTLSGEFHGFAEDFNTKFNITSGLGDIDADMSLRLLDDSKYAIGITAEGIDLKSILGLDDEAETSFVIAMNGEGLELDDTNFEADMHCSTLKLNGMDFSGFDIHGSFNNEYLKTTTAVDYPFLDMNLRAGVDLRYDKPVFDIKALISHADLAAFNLAGEDSLMFVSADIDAEFKGDDIDNITGWLEVRDMRFFNGENYYMQSLSANINEQSKIKEIYVDCDFFDFSLNGNINFNTFANTMKNTAMRYIDKPDWFGYPEPDKEIQEFSFNLNLKDTQTLSKLFMPSLYISSGTTATMSYTNRYSDHGGWTVNSPEIKVGDVQFVNVDFRNDAKYDKYAARMTFDDIVLRDTTENDPNKINIEKFVFDAVVANDTIKTDIFWNDLDLVDHNKAHIISTFAPSTHGGLLTIKSDTILVNDTLWHINPNCHVDFGENSTTVKDFDLFTDYQRISLHGLYPRRDTDTLSAEFVNVDVSDFDFITKSDNINLDGILNGTFDLSGLGDNLSFSSDMQLKEMYLNGKEVGDVTANANWYKPSESILVNMNVYNKSFKQNNHESVVLLGFYYPKKKHDNIQFDMTFNDFKLETVSPFVSVISRMDGFMSGNLRVRGSLAEPTLKGEISFKDAGCHINYLNTFYKINNNIKIGTDTIVFNNIVLTDTIGNRAVIKGNIYHDHLKDFDLDLTMTCDDFLAINIPVEQADGFYGTAIADGNVKIKGPLDNMQMTIDVTTQKGTEIGIPLSGTSTIDNSFVVFVNRSLEPEEEVQKQEKETVKTDSDFAMDLNARITSDAAVNIFLPQNMGNINARGNGNLKIGYNSNEMTLRGNYMITSGSFNFTLEMVKRTFTLRRGGTISWTGDPMDADINIVGVYRTKSSLTSLGSSVVDSTALTNNINVDCIIKLSDKLMNPTITFGIELPNAKEDTRNLVYSIIDTTNQSVMAQQVFSLMMLGSFSYTAESNIARFGTTAGYSVITNQLSNWLSQISNDFDIGINYTPNDQLTNEELEVALSTQLFDDRLIIEGNFGVIRGNRSDADNANNIVGDVDLTFRLTKRLSLKAYNHTNIKNNYYYYSIENYSDFTQGVGISLSQSFDNLREVFTIHRKNKKKSKGSNDESVPK